jgi:hypothetical protein
LKVAEEKVKELMNEVEIQKREKEDLVEEKQEVQEMFQKMKKEKGGCHD